MKGGHYAENIKSISRLGAGVLDKRYDSEEKRRVLYIGRTGDHSDAGSYTVWHITSGVDEELLTLAFTDWMGNILSTRGIHIVIDGKALKGSGRKNKGPKSPLF